MKLRQAVQDHNRYSLYSNMSRTENGADTFACSGDALVDLFFKAGSARKMSDYVLNSMFDAAYAQDGRLAMQTLAWMRDIRGGAGERRAFRTILRHISTSHRFNREFVEAMVRAVPEYGRFDDLFVVFGTQYEDLAIGVILRALNDSSQSGLVAKWMPRKGPHAAKLARAAGDTPRRWRKRVVGLSNTVEQQMCANRWEAIDYNKVPSVASARYRKAFYRHDTYGYQRWVDGLSSGTSKVSAGAIFPHDVIKPCFHSYQLNRVNATQIQAMEAQWKALPDFLEGQSAKILPIVDVSGSMCTPVSGSTQAIHVSVGLGMYLAERMQGPFNGLFMSFSGRPEFVEVRGENIYAKVRNMVKSNWGMNTNLQASLQLLLRVASQNGVTRYDMPETLLIMSDMEFDSCAEGTNLDGIRAQYEGAGYEMPQVVFWNLNSRQRNNTPVQAHDTGTALVSGFSPSILKGVLGNPIDPRSVFRDTVDVPRYRIFG